MNMLLSRREGASERQRQRETSLTYLLFVRRLCHRRSISTGGRFIWVIDPGVLPGPRFLHLLMHVSTMKDMKGVYGSEGALMPAAPTTTRRCVCVCVCVVRCKVQKCGGGYEEPERGVYAVDGSGLSWCLSFRFESVAGWCQRGVGHGGTRPVPLRLTVNCTSFSLNVRGIVGG